jgi:hypothetical protein
MKNIIKKLLREQRLSYNEKVSKVLEPPYFHNMKEQFGITEYKDKVEILSYLFNDNISVHGKTIENSNGDEIYNEENNGYWRLWNYNEDGNVIYSEDRSGSWSKSIYDENGKEISYEESNGYIWVDNEDMN